MLYPQRPSVDIGFREILSLSQNDKWQACMRNISEKHILFALQPRYYKPAWFEGETQIILFALHMDILQDYPISDRKWNVLYYLPLWHNCVKPEKLR